MASLVQESPYLAMCEDSERFEETKNAALGTILLVIAEGDAGTRRAKAVLGSKVFPMGPCSDILVIAMPSS